MRKAIVLSRVSTLQQDLRQQTEEILREVYKDGYKKEEVIVIEDKESAIKLSEEERRGLNKLKEHIRTDPTITAVYIYELSRLSRRQLVLFSIRDFLIEHNIQLICLKPYFKLLEPDGKMSQTGSLMFSIFSSMSESEMALAKERMMRGRKFNIAMGKSGGGRAPFGYMTDKDKRYVIHPEQAAILRRIFHDYAYSGKSQVKISKELKEEGLFPHLQLHSLNNQINLWIRRTYYTGTNQFPPIISKALFAEAQKSTERNRTVHTNTPREKFLLKGLIRDAQTGYLLHSNSNSGHYQARRVSSLTISMHNIDPLVWSAAKELYEKFVVNKELLHKQLLKEIGTLSAKIDHLNRELSSIHDKMGRVEEHFIFGRLRKARAEELIAELSVEQMEIETRLVELANESAMKQCQINDVLLSEEIDDEKLSLNEKIEIVKKVIYMVTVRKPSRKETEVKLYNKINNEVLVYRVDCWRRSWQLISQSNRAENPPPKIPKSHETRIKNRTLLI